ncbi:MAG: ABC transporter substrate-binding protein, partial [Candidatus Rokubacteria bacterium]|nr:ABC transporter substrate-binding protein [Candidatus Rokubacteria bacterium]
MRLKTLGAWLSIFLFCATSAWAQAKVPGVTDTEVVIGLTTPLSGPAAAWGNTARGMEAWAAHVNEQGGVHGRKIKLVLKDDGYVPGRAVANVTEMKDSVFAIVGLLGTAIVGAAKDVAINAKTPLVAPFGNARIFVKEPRENMRGVFVTNTDYPPEGEFLGTHAIRQLKAQKLAVFYQNDEYGKGGLDGVRKAAAAASAQVVGEVSYELSDRALGTHALKLKESGADAVILYPTSTHGALILKEMAGQGYRPTILASFTLAGDLWEGVYVNVAGQVGPITTPEAVRASEILTKYEPRLKGREYAGLYGAVSMMLTIEGLKRAGRDLTRE